LLFKSLESSTYYVKKIIRYKLKTGINFFHSYIKLLSKSYLTIFFSTY